MRITRFFWLAVLLLNSGLAIASVPPVPKGLIALEGRTAPPLVLKDMDGKTTRLSDLKGRWVMVHFWASWCGPCRREMPTLQDMVKALPSNRFALVLVNTAETDDQVFAFLPTVAPELNTLMDRDGKVTERWKPRGLPSSFLVDPEGQIKYVALGGREWGSKPYLDFLRALVAADKTAPDSGAGTPR